MDLTRYVEELQHELLVAAEAGGDEARRLAERLVAPLQSATRLVLLDALSAAAGEITAELAPGSVELRLRGRDPQFVVTSPAHHEPLGDEGFARDATADADAPAAPTASADASSGAGEGDDGGTARVTLRLPEPLKLRIEEAAARDALSVNAWLVRTLAATVEPGGRGARPTRRSPSGGDRFTGWARS